jgi:hypothetical protein
MKLQAWIPNIFFEKPTEEHILKFLDYDVIEEINSEHPDFKNCPIKLKTIKRWAKISNGESVYVVACVEHIDGTLIFPTKKI